MPEGVDPHRRVSAARVRELCGGVSNMSLHRWLNDEDLGFPKPIKIGGRRYWRESDIVAWLDARERGEVAA